MEKGAILVENDCFPVDECVSTAVIAERMQVSERTIRGKIKAAGFRPVMMQKNATGSDTPLYSWQSWKLFSDFEAMSQMSYEGKLKYATGHLVVEEIRLGNIDAIGHLNGIVPGLGDAVEEQYKQRVISDDRASAYRIKAIEAEYAKDKAEKEAAKSLRVMKKYCPKDVAVEAIMAYEKEALSGEEDEGDV